MSPFGAPEAPRFSERQRREQATEPENNREWTRMDANTTEN